MKLSEITFPVFQISKHIKVTTIDKSIVVLYKDTLEDDLVIKYIDDLTINSPTIGTRRLQILLRGDKLFKLTDAVYYLADMLKLCKISNRFIDSSGNMFTYKKGQKASLIFKAIDNIIPVATGGSIITIKGSMQRYKTLGRVTTESKYAGLLEVSPFNYILYGVYPTKGIDTWRKI